MYCEAMGGGGLRGLGRGQYRPTGHIMGGGVCGEVSTVKWSGVEWSGATRGVAEAERSGGKWRERRWRTSTGRD